jgi:hypothetical protein
MNEYIFICFGSIICVPFLGKLMYKKYNEPRAPTVFYDNDPLDKPLLNKYLVKNSEGIN